MLLVRVLAAAAKPALVGGALSAAAAGGFFAVHKTRDHGGVSAFRQAQGHGQQLLISEFGDTTDTIVAVDPNDVSVRKTVVTIDHAPGYGVFPVLAPDGTAIAYTALPAGVRNPSPDAPAQAAVVDDDGRVKLLADDVDLLVPPVWSPDSRSVVVRKNTPAQGSAGSFELLLLARDGARATLTTWSTAAVFPIAFAPDGSKLYFATLNNAGTDLYAIAPDGSSETKLAHLSDEIARDWKLSPDGATLAYSVAETGATPGVVTRALDLGSGRVSDVLAATTGPREEFNPAFRADGKIAVASVKPRGGSAVSVADAGGARDVASNDAAIDLPIGWSPDGGTLAVHSVDGRSPLEAAGSHIDLVRDDGGRTRVSDSADVLIVGWLR